MCLRLEFLRQHTVERGDRIGQHRRAGYPARPLSEGETVVAVDALLAAEGEREQRVILMQKVDRKSAFFPDARVRAGVAVDADDQRGWIVRERAGRRH